MTEEEKKRLAKNIFQQENERMKSNRVFHSAEMNNALRRMERQQSLFVSLAQQGITWQDLKRAYDAAFQRGQKEMLYFHMTFFYASTAIAYKGRFPDAGPEQVADFMRSLSGAPMEEEDHIALTRLCLEETGFDAGPYDNQNDGVGHVSRANTGTHLHASRKDLAAISRMQRSGITEADLAYERETGYSNGWKSDFHYSACIAELGITLHRMHCFGAEDIESFVDRIQSITDEEISVADILSRCEAETDVDVSRMAGG
ncbi:MAG: hypothetical protein IJ089_14100 [Clostridia bacterium]|nr:hypothetical protein [Clostridia bacterium]MBQ8964898.1 hypothetical protein [Clostridia bacterium]